KAVMFFIMAVALALVSSGAEARGTGREGNYQLGGGLGLAFHDPIRFEVELDGEYFFWQHVGLGLNLDLLIHDVTMFLFEPFARYHFDISAAPKWVPYVGGGLGVAVDTDGNGFMDVMVPDFGFQYELTDRLFLGTDMSLHILTDFNNSIADF